MDTKLNVNGNDITLKQTRHDGQDKGRCYHTWSGTYEILESTRSVTIEDVNSLCKYGIFGYGQSVNASVVGNEIHYSGVCDSGD
jgi:hypothetical protein